ncbi:cysteine-rich with EGF-like domain protein 2 isoform X1 [Vanessa atalanta]|uniref:cysteine-rich with EGF-like domain protein 2 isoform X1 n=1 Tax=Vanessa atalanta TaxID=42275 RepID=UPI001FCD8D67|nr:cysteine-rich with EGF-like domain protein 2 isoform X1 [Vanessa atalanta]XP_047543556.1 cysteine-rich with EGF-like domain protein 2 isoform X1 [Vanessa atalanta]XP_047543566.1 cysteine-rich with EGF-like domain protein 2 isoform X1 [Vanessa atalanta]
MKIKQRILYELCTLLVGISSISCSVQPPTMNPGLLTPSKSIGECQSCRLFIDSFKNGLERTSRGKYEGGDAAWEEEKLKKSYKRSEIRLVDIQENICKEVSKYSNQCHHMAEQAEEYIEEWWAQDPDESTDLYTYICIQKLQVCCPKHHYGKDCMPCIGDHDNLCSGNGKCRGDGTRKGNGTCLCNPEYTGTNCEQCALGYFELELEDKKVKKCFQCHRSCLGGCRQATQRDCVACKPGYLLDPKEGCVDINECRDDKICTKDQFCLNSMGSYACVDCDKSCKGCFGDGPDTCVKCAKGYLLKDEVCISDVEQEEPSQRLTSARYMTYVGLIITTGILLPKSTPLGGLVGILVLSYIMGSEYYCMINGHTGLVNLKEYDLFHLFRL